MIKKDPKIERIIKKDKTSVGSRVGFSKDTVTGERERLKRKMDKVR